MMMALMSIVFINVIFIIIVEDGYYKPRATNVPNRIYGSNIAGVIMSAIGFSYVGKIT